MAKGKNQNRHKRPNSGKQKAKQLARRRERKKNAKNLS